MARVGFDFEQFYREKNKMRAPDGIHCVIPNCQNLLRKNQRKYCSHKCHYEWFIANVNSWDITRDQAIKRDGKCMDCGCEHPGRFEVHHILPIYEGGNEFDVSNCITLCMKCHKKRHSRVGKRMRKNKSLDTFNKNWVEIV